MLGFIEIIVSCIGLYGVVTQNVPCAIIGLVLVAVCDFIDIFITGHNPTTIWLACVLAIGASIANRNPLYTFTIALCGESLIMSIITILLVTTSYVFNKSKMDEEQKQDNKYIELSNIVMKGLNVSNIDEALKQTYDFYKNQGVDVDIIQIDIDNKSKTLSKLVMLGLGTNDINKAIEDTEDFYKSQSIEINNE